MIRFRQILTLITGSVCIWILSEFLLALSENGSFPLSPDLASSKEELRYQKEQDIWMRSDDSPLALAGLYWLKPGENRLGTDSSNQIVLPPGSAPARVGSLEVKANHVLFEAEPQVRVLFRNSPVTSIELQSDDAGSGSDVLTVGELRLKVIKRGEKLGLRLINLKNPALLDYRGLNFFPVNPAYRIEGKFSSYPYLKKLKIANILGQVDEMGCPGVVEFNLQGKSLRLEPIFESPSADRLFFMFKDETNGKETYEGGRYLYSNLPTSGRVILDFNLAHNPYCAYTAYSTCQMPPRQNWLKVRIPAGEMKYKGLKE